MIAIFAIYELIPLLEFFKPIEALFAINETSHKYSRFQNLHYVNYFTIVFNIKIFYLNFFFSYSILYIYILNLNESIAKKK